MAEHSLATASFGVWGEVRGEVKGWGGGGVGGEGGAVQGTVLSRIATAQKHRLCLESSAPLVERNGGAQPGDSQHKCVG